MKKIIKILTFGCLFVLGGVVKLQAMDPDIKLRHAEKYLKQLKSERDALNIPEPKYIQRLEEAEGGLRQAQQGSGEVDVLNVEYYKSLVADILKEKPDFYYEKFKDLKEKISSQEAEVKKLRAEVKGAEEKKEEEVVEPFEEPETVGVEEAEEISEKFEIYQPLEQPEKKQKRFPTKTVVGVGLGAAAAVAAAGTLYAGLKWYQKKRIRRVIGQHGLELSAFSPVQKDVMAAAVLASYGIPGGMWYFKRMVQNSELASQAISQEIMWTILADLYYRKVPTIEEVQMLKERIM